MWKDDRELLQDETGIDNVLNWLRKKFSRMVWLGKMNWWPPLPGPTL